MFRCLSASGTATIGMPPFGFSKCQSGTSGVMCRCSDTAPFERKCNRVAACAVVGILDCREKPLHPFAEALAPNRAPFRAPFRPGPVPAKRIVQCRFEDAARDRIVFIGKCRKSQPGAFQGDRAAAGHRIEHCRQMSPNAGRRCVRAAMSFVRGAPLEMPASRAGS